MNTYIKPNKTSLEQQYEAMDIDFDTILGTSGSDDPVVAFCDEKQIIMYEQYNEHGDWWGWKIDTVECPAEYFKRKLKGK